jgi:hypothetical protein
MDDLRARISRVAETAFTVLVEGESGVGKELVARQIHLCSRRYRGPLVAVNCAALVETLVEAELFGIEERTATGVRGRRGKFELAHQGTLILDEVADLSPASQAKLLRVLQDWRWSVGGHAVRTHTRVIAATNRSLRSPWMWAGFAPTSTTASPASRFACRRCVPAARTSRCWSSTWSRGIGARRRFPRRPWRRRLRLAWKRSARRAVERSIALAQGRSSKWLTCHLNWRSTTSRCRRWRRNRTIR